MAPSDSEAFFEEQKEASRFKVEVYRRYLRPFCWKLLSAYPRVFIVDGYAGAGAYAPGPDGTRAEGSPLAAAKVAREIELKYESPRAQLINVERDAKIFERLRKTLMPYPQLTTNILGRFDDHLDEILTIVGNAPTMFFIDPFGMEGADLRLVDRILERRSRKTELLIHFSHKAFERMAGNLDAKAKTPAARQAAATKVRNLTAIMGTPWWQGIWRDPELSTEEKCGKAADLYRAQLRERGIEHVHPIRMRDTYTGPTKYELVFATRSAHGVYLLSDTVSGYEAALFEEEYRDTFEIQWKKDERAAARMALEAEIHRWGLAREEATPVRVYMHFAPLHFGTWRSSDYDGCLRRLVAAGGIDREKPSGIKPGERLRFVPLPAPGLFDSLSG